MGAAMIRVGICTDMAKEIGALRSLCDRVYKNVVLTHSFLELINLVGHRLQ